MSSVPKPPKHLESHGIELWKRMTAAHNFADQYELELLAVACAARDRISACEADIKMNGLSITTSHGGLSKNPACTILREAEGTMMKAFKMLGLEYAPPKAGKKPHAGWAG